MADTTALKKNTFINFRGNICEVVDSQHVNPGKGSAFVRTKLRDVSTGRTLENTFKTSETVDVVDMDRANMQYLYKDAQGYNFMDNSSYEQVAIPAELLGDRGQYLTEGIEVTVLSYQGNPMSVDLPKKLKLKVTESMPAVKGDTASGNVTKEATLETGLVIDVPMFIKEGDTVIINTDDGSYVERA